MDQSTRKRRKLLSAAAAVLFSLSVFSATVFATSDINTNANGNAGNSQGAIDNEPHPSDIPRDDSQPSGGGGHTDSGDSTGSGDTHNSSGANHNSEAENSATSTPEETVNSHPAEKPGETDNSSKHTNHGQTSSKAPVYVAPPAGVASVEQDSRKPTGFTSNDLQGLLSGAGSSLASTDGFLREDTPTNGSSSSGGTSSLLLGGIALILVGLAGVVLFVYRQFFVNKKRPVASGVTGPLPAIPMPKPAPKKAPAPLPQKPEEAARPVDQEQPHQPQKPEETPNLSPSEYTDISSGRTAGPDRDGFDWDKFFKNIPPDDSSKQ